jgi:hypothetical protein
MKRLLAVLGTAAALALAAAPANADQGPGDPPSTNCDELKSLATQGVPGAGVSNLADAPTDTQAKLFPVHFVGSDGGCTIDVSGPP